MPVALQNLFDDAFYWFSYEVFEGVEAAVRFKHKLVSIHCFPNGNGRHSRIIGDIIAYHVYDLPFFSWGQNQSESPITIRNQYLKAVRRADKGDYQELIQFALS